jgi:O-acetyl-ADP-ribose deacetylase (regulator of RNase III)
LLWWWGVDGQIHLKAWNELYKECNYLRETEYPNWIEEWMVVLTIWYKLKAKYILHAHAPVCHKYKDDSWMKVMESTYQVCLDLADEKWLKSITFPFLWAWIFCCDREKSAKIALNIAKEYIINNQNSWIEKITFILWREKDYELFESINK